jgi:hypothetical protein
MNLLEQFVKKHAIRGTVDGQRVMGTDGDPLLVAAFKQLGWSDPCPAQDACGPFEDEAATVEHHERAVMDRPKGHQR